MKYALQQSLFDGAISRLPVKRKNLSEWHTCIFFNLAIQLDERNFHLLAQSQAQSGFARSAQSDKRHALAPLRLFLTKFAQQTHHRIFGAMGWKPFQESLDQNFFVSRFRFRREELRQRN